MFSNSVVIVNVNDVASDFDIRLVFFWSNSSCVCASVLDWLQSVSSVWLFKFKFIKSLHNYLRKSSLPKIIIRMIFLDGSHCSTASRLHGEEKPTTPRALSPGRLASPLPHPLTPSPGSWQDAHWSSGGARSWTRQSSATAAAVGCAGYREWWWTQGPDFQRGGALQVT